VTLYQHLTMMKIVTDPLCGEEEETYFAYLLAFPWKMSSLHIG